MAPSIWQRTWDRPEWPHTALRRIDTALAGRPISRTGPPEQVKKWSVSAVLRVPTDHGFVWYKEVPPVFSHEGQVISWLARLVPGSVPEVISAGRGWHLTAGIPQSTAPGASPCHPLETIVPIQCATIGRAADVLALGCPDRRLRTVPADITVLLDTCEFLGAQDTAALRHLMPVLEATCADLESRAIPSTLVHGDVNGSNSVWTRSGWMHVDWTDACLAHPFVDLAQPLLDADVHEGLSIESAFVRQWSRHAPQDDVFAALRASRVVGAAHQVGTYRRIVDQVGPVDGHPELLVTWVRHLIDALEERSTAETATAADHGTQTGSPFPPMRRPTGSNGDRSPWAVVSPSPLPAPQGDVSMPSPDHAARSPRSTTRHGPGLLTARNGTAPPHQCRAVVIGAGLAGLEVAKELDRRGFDGVLVIEAGPQGELRHNNAVLGPHAALRAWLEPHTDAYFHRPWSSLSSPHYAGSSGIRQRLGGRSLYWYGVTLPIEDWALAAPWWPTAVREDLCTSWQGGDSLYTRVSRELREWSSADTSQPPLVDESLTGSVAGLHLVSTPRAIRRASSSPDRWYAYSPLDTWRDPETGAVLREPVGTRILTGTSALHVEVVGGRCRGVVRADDTGEPTLIEAETVVLAAGTVENSRLALQGLATAGNDLRRLTGLSDHIVQGFFLRVSSRVADRLLASIPPGNYWAPCGTRSNLFVDVQYPTSGGAVVDVRTTGEQLPSAACYVECPSASAYPWPARVHAVPSAEDELLIKSQRNVLQAVADDLAHTAGSPATALEFDEFHAAERSNAFVLPESIDRALEGVPVTWSSFLGMEDHEGGTLPIGRVLDEDLQITGVQGLYVAGPSAFPRAGAANPSLTTLALARRLAAGIADVP
ncbi:FAD-dependent oxidoreductase [Streptomyces sp. NPDC006265]|uniref:FAD-dependent oxidoreductase n=1 Tax=Streptomyces sp. NPDC006265 TaxID=3156740 RepID=UPI0033BC0FDB